MSTTCSVGESDDRSKEQTYQQLAGLRVPGEPNNAGANAAGAAKISKTCGKGQRYVRTTLQARFGGARRHTRAPVPLPQGCGVRQGLRRRWGGRARVQWLAVGEWGRVLPPKRMHWNQGNIVAHAYPGLLRLLRPLEGGGGWGRGCGAQQAPPTPPQQHHLPAGIYIYMYIYIYIYISADRLSARKELIAVVCTPSPAAVTAELRAGAGGGEVRGPF